MGAMIGTTLSDRAAITNEGVKNDTGAVSGLNMIAARLSPGAISESSSSHLPPIEGSYPTPKPVMFPPGWLSRGTMPLAGNSRHGPACEDDVGAQADQLLRERSCPIDVSASHLTSIRRLRPTVQ